MIKPAATVVFILFVCAAPVLLHAQRGGAGRGDGSHGVVGGHVTAPTPPTPSSAGLSISRPIGTDISSVRTNPPLGMGSPVRSPFDARPGTYTAPRGQGSFGIPLSYGVGIGSYADTATPDRPQAARQQDPEVGILYVDASPRTAMVFVDTAYVGAVDDLQATGVRLSPGRHWVDLEAADYERKTIEVIITPGQPLRYRVDLTPVRRAALTIIPARPPQTMYAIPGCYGGNRPPVPSALPSGCDIAQVRVIRARGN